MTIVDQPIEAVDAANTALLSGADALRLLEQAQTGMYLVQDGKIVYANAMLAELLGCDASALIGQSHDVIAPEEYRVFLNTALARRLDGKVGRPGQMRCVRRNGSSFDARVIGRRIEFDAKPAVLITLMDITELSIAVKRAEWNAGMLARTEALCRSGSFEVVLPGGQVVLSSGMRTLIGKEDSVPADGDIDALHWIPADEQAFVAGIWRNAAPGEPFEFQHRVQHTDGHRLVVLHRGLVSVGETNGNLRGVALLKDITAQRDAEMRIQELATHDEVTGLPNRAAFLDQVDATVHAARWESRCFMLLVMDVARIAEVKAKMGFGAGDTLAMALAARLQQTSGHGETVAHLSDTEFALLLEHESDIDVTVVQRRAESLRQTLEAPVRLGNTDIFPQVVIGIASFPGDGDEASRLLECAQTARLSATVHTGFAFFKPDSNQRAMREMRMESALRRALERDELELQYQPQVDLSNGMVVGAEALLRWNSPELGRVSPSEFIPLAERSGLIGVLGDWVLRRACEQTVFWRRAGLRPVRIGVNLSPSQLQRPDLAGHVQSVMIQTGADPACLGIEVTESTAMADPQRAAIVLSEIKAIGIEISLDDFGTGFSSLSCLRSLPIDVVKVDRSFVHDVTAAPEDVSVTRAIITMAHGLQMQVLAEGVETEGQLSLLAANSCDIIQGYWFSPSLTAEGFEQLLREDRRLPDRFVTRVRRTQTLLIVDDEDNILSALKRLFRRDGYSVVTAKGAAEGLQRLAETEVDVIVSDQRMPGMTGVEFLRRAKELYPDSVRMVLSGYTELQSIIDAVNEGAIYKFLTKPWDDDLLRAHVAEAFRRKQLSDENRRLARQVENANADYMALNTRLEKLVAQQRDQADMLASSASNMHDVIDQLPAPVLGLDSDGAIAFLNREAADLMPRAAQMLGRPAEDFLHFKLLHNGPSGSEREVEVEGNVYRVLTRSLHNNGSERGCLLLLVPTLIPSVDRT